MSPEVQTGKRPYFRWTYFAIRGRIRIRARNNLNASSYGQLVTLIKIYYVVLHVYYFELLILPVHLLVHITNSCVPFQVISVKRELFAISHLGAEPKRAPQTAWTRARTVPFDYFAYLLVWTPEAPTRSVPTRLHARPPRRGTTEKATAGRFFVLRRPEFECQAPPT